jgi:hypothetical protein
MPRPALRILIASPLVLLGVYVAGVTPQVPLLDDWAFTEFARLVASGEAGWRDWLAPHNGSHVVVLPRIVMTSVAFASGGSGRAQLLVSFAVIVWTAWTIVRIGDRSPAAGRPALWWAQGATLLLLCSPASYRAFIWPVAFCHFTVNACVVTAAWQLSRPPVEGATRAVLVAGAACLAASLTRAEGLAAWVVMLPSLWLATRDRRLRARFVLGWLGAFGLCCAIVYLSLVQLAPETSKPLSDDLLAEPVLIIGNALGIIGMPFGVALDSLLGDALPSPRRYFWLGIPLVAGYVYWGIRGLLSGDEGVRRATLAWLSIGAFGGLFAGATAAARIGVLERAFLGDIWPSNYTVTAALVGVAALQLAALNGARVTGADPALESKPDWPRWAVAALTVALLLGAFATRGPAALHQRARSRWSGQCWELFEHLAPINSCFVRQPKREEVAAYETLGFRTIRSDIEVVPDARPGRGGVEAVAGPGPEPNQVEIEGWVRVAREGPRPVVWVEIDRFPGLFAPARVDAPAEGDRARWSVAVPMLDGEPGVKAWLYRRDAGRLVRLAGSVRIPASAGAGG